MAPAAVPAQFLIARMACVATLLPLLLIAQQKTDPLIAQTAQRWVYFGFIAFLIAMTLAIGVFFRRLEGAIVFAALLTAVLIYLMMTL